LSYAYEINLLSGLLIRGGPGLEVPALVPETGVNGKQANLTEKGGEAVSIAISCAVDAGRPKYVGFACLARA
jgi:hypothetical protein